MVARLAGAPLLGIVGPSGSGKSSVLRAGPAARARARRAPRQRALGDRAAAPRAPTRVAALEQAVAQAAPDGRLVIAVDQFEELFTACRDEARAGGVRRRARRRRARPAPPRARPDRAARRLLRPLRELPGAVADAGRQPRAGRPDAPRRAAPRDRAARPARRACASTPRSSTRWSPTSRASRAALPLLSTALLELWQERDGQRLDVRRPTSAPAACAARSRGWPSASTTELDAGRAGARAGDPRAAGRRRRGRRRRAPPPAARRARAHAGRGEVLAELADGRLVTVSGEEAEVAHEALLREWPRLRSVARGGRRGPAPASPPRHRRARVGRARPRPRRALPRRPARRRPRLVGRPRPRARRGRARVRRREPRRERRAPSAGCARVLARRRRRCSSLAVIAGLVALEQRGTARDQATAADAQRLGSRALAENDLDRSLLLARQGVALDDSPQTRGSLLAALIKSPAAHRRHARRAASGMTALALSPDGRTLAAGDAAGNVFLFDTRTRRRVRRPTCTPGDWRDRPARLQPGRPPARGCPQHRRRGRRHARGYAHGSRRAAAGALRLRAGDHAGCASRATRRSTWPATRPAARPLPQPTVERFDARQRAAGPGPAHARAPAELAAARLERRPARADGLGRRSSCVRDATTLKPRRARSPSGRCTGQRDRAGPDDRTAAVGERGRLACASSTCRPAGCGRRRAGTAER